VRCAWVNVITLIWVKTMFEDVIKYLVDNLDIEVEQITEFGPVETIKVKLLVDGNVISESECSLPEQRYDHP